jgi:PhzF family phenazine biosynthesis protein
MITLPFFQVDAFAGRPFEGNPAAVVPLDQWLPDELMQAIAAENNLSETAFTVPSTSAEADYDLRWFTPTVEVDLCGHATLAAAHVLLRTSTIRFATRSGGLSVSRDEGKYWLDLPAYGVEEGAEPGLLEALGVAGPVFLGRGGNGAAIVLLDDEAAVRGVTPDFTALRTIDRLVMVTAPGRSTDIVTRVFAAFHGIDEDPVTGSAHAALVPFWAERLGRDAFAALQASRRSGRLDCRLQRAHGGGAASRVRLGGTAVTVIEGHFHL